MITIDDVLSKENVSMAFDTFAKKRDGCGPDGMHVSELGNYWKANGTIIERQIRNGSWRPGIAKAFEASTHTGKQREIANINVLDRFVERLVQQCLRRELEPGFLPNSMAYQEGKGTPERRMLGYDLVLADGEVELRKHQYAERKSFPTWHESSVTNNHGEYHIVQDGIINRKDYSLLFKNDNERHHIPVVTRGMPFCNELRSSFNVIH